MFRELYSLADQITDRYMTPIDEAKRLGTFDQDDRSLQYREAEPKKLLAQLNTAWSTIRTMQRGLADRDKLIASLQTDKRKLFWLLGTSITCTAGVTALAMKGLELLYAALK